MRLIQFADNPVQSDEDQAKIAKLNSLKEAARKERKKVELEWQTNAYILAGKQGEAYANDVLRYTRVVIPPVTGKANVNINLIYPLVRQAAAAGVDNSAQQVAIAATSDPDDMSAAELATDLIAHGYDRDDEYNLRLHEELWRLTTGFCLRHTSWDPKKTGYGLNGMELKGAGDIDTTTLTPLLVYVCPWVDASKPRPWYIISDVRDVDEIFDLYKKKVEPEEVAEDARIANSLLTSVVTQGNSSPDTRKHPAILNRLYHIPGANYPNGRVWTWSGNVLLDETDLPEGAMPFQELVWFPVPGRIYPYPFISPLAGLNHEIVRSINQMIELKNRQLRGDIIVKGNPR